MSGRCCKCWGRRVKCLSRGLALALCSKQSACEGPARPSPFSEADTGFRQSQASLIWEELEEEAERQEDARRGLFLRPRLQQRRTRGHEDEEEEEGGPGGPQALRRRRQKERRRRGYHISDYSDDDCVRYFVVGTVVALLALALNLIYPLL